MDDRVTANAGVFGSQAQGRDGGTGQRQMRGAFALVRMTA